MKGTLSVKSGRVNCSLKRGISERSAHDENDGGKRGESLKRVGMIICSLIVEKTCLDQVDYKT